jgi:hypothetical protein
MHRRIWTVLMAMAALVSLTGCAARQVTLRSEQYVPEVEVASFVKYKGKLVFVSQVVNTDDTTTKWGYKDADQRLWYIMGDTTLEEYVRKCLIHTFHKVGMRMVIPNDTGGGISIVHGTPPFRVWSELRDAKLPPGTKDIRITLISISSRSVVFKLSIIREEILIYSGTMKASLNEGSENKRNDEDFQNYAYRLMDRMAETILKSPDFEAAFLKGL